MSRRRRSKSKIDIFSLIGLLLLLAIIGKCGSILSPTDPADRQATESVRGTRYANSVTEQKQTYYAHVTSVQETIERDWVLATVTAIYMRTIRPTLNYEATHDRFSTQIAQKMTVDTMLTEIANNERGVP